MISNCSIRGAFSPALRSYKPFKPCQKLLLSQRQLRVTSQVSDSGISRRTACSIPLVLSALPTQNFAMAASTGLKREKLTGTDQEVVILNNGLSMPLLGLGTAKLKGDEAETAVKHALGKAGYKHVDTAAMYNNEDAVGRGIKVADRNSIFITTKLGNDAHDKVAEAVQGALQRLDTDYIDLFLIHWPVTEKPRKDGDTDPPIKETWQAMEKAVDQGYIKSIGLSNFSIKKLKDVQSYARIQPAVNQVEVHVWHRNDPLIKYCEDTGVQIQAYSPIGGLPLWEGKRPKDDPFIIDMARKYGKSPCQHGSCVVPKSGSPERIDENADIWGWSLKKEDFDSISSIKYQERMCKGQFFLDQSPYNNLDELWDGEA